MAAQVGLCLVGSETPEDTFRRVVAQFCQNASICSQAIELKRKVLRTESQNHGQPKNSIHPTPPTLYAGV